MEELGSSEQIQNGNIGLRGEISAKDYLISTEVEIKPEYDQENYEFDEIKDVYHQIEVLKKVKEEHVEEINYSCEKCKVTLSSEAEVWDHTKTIHMTSIMCNKGYKSENCLIKHIESHFGSVELDLIKKDCKHDTSMLKNAKRNLINKNLTDISKYKNENLNFESITVKTKEKPSSRSEIDLSTKDDCSEHNKEENKCERTNNSGKYSKLNAQKDKQQFDINILKPDDNIKNFRLEIDLGEDAGDIRHVQKEEISKIERDKKRNETEENKENASEKAKPPTKGRYSCSICSKTFTLKQNRRRHMHQFHGNVESYVCDCGKVFKNRRNQQYHSELYCNHIEPKTKTHLCHLCAKIFRNSEYLRKHVKAIHKHIKLNMTKEPLICDYCKQEYRYKFNLMRHINQTHMGIVKRPFECKYCKKTFKRSSTLNKHLITHEIEKQFKCKKCLKKFKSRWGCLQHEKNICLL